MGVGVAVSAAPVRVCLWVCLCVYVLACLLLHIKFAQFGAVWCLRVTFDWPQQLSDWRPKVFSNIFKSNFWPFDAIMHAIVVCACLYLCLHMYLYMCACVCVYACAFAFAAFDLISFVAIWNFAAITLRFFADAAATLASTVHRRP